MYYMTKNLCDNWHTGSPGCYAPMKSFSEDRMEMSVNQVSLFLWLSCNNSIVGTNVWKPFRLRFYGMIKPKSFGILRTSERCCRYLSFSDLIIFFNCAS